MQDADISVLPYSLFDPKNYMFGGIPPFELVVDAMDQPQHRDRNKYPWYPILRDGTYFWADKAELDDPEFESIIQTQRYFNACHDYPRYDGIYYGAVPLPYHLRRNVDKDNNYTAPDDEEDIDMDLNCYSEEYFKEISTEYYDYIDDIDYTDCETTTDYFDEPLKLLQLECNNPTTRNAFLTLLKRTCEIASVEIEHARPSNSKDFEEKILTASIHNVVNPGQAKIIPEHDSLHQYLGIYEECKQQEFPLNSLATDITCAVSNNSQLGKRIRGNNFLKDFHLLLGDNKVVESVSMLDMVKYYFNDDPHLRDFILYIQSKRIEGNDVIRRILLDEFFRDYEPDYTPKSPGMEVETVEPPGIIVTIISDANKYNRLLVFCIMYSFQCMNLNIDNVARSIINRLQLGRKITRGKKKGEIDYTNWFKEYRKKFGFIFLSLDFVSKFKAACRKVISIK